LPNEKHKADKLNLKYPSPAPVGYLSDMMSGTCNGQRPRPASESKRHLAGSVRAQVQAKGWQASWC